VKIKKAGKGGERKARERSEREAVHHEDVMSISPVCSSATVAKNPGL